MKIKSLLAGSLLCGTLLFPAGQAQAFSDTSAHWAQNDIQRLTSLQAIGGYEDGTFRPEHSITRAEFSKILSKSLALPLSSGQAFNDTKDHWANDDLFTLVQNHILVPAEYSGYYSPDTAITRAEIAVMLVRAYGLEEQAAALAGTATGFADDDAIASYHKGYLVLARQLDLIGGYDDGSFRPQATATRAEATAMIVRLLDASANPTDPSETATPNTPPVTSVRGSEQTSQGLSLSIDTLSASQPQITNSLGEQIRTTSFSLMVQNTTALPLTISSQQLQISAIYSQNGQRREAPVLVNAFSLTVPAGGTLQQPVSIRTILPTSLVAQMTLGQQLTGYAAIWQSGSQTTALPKLSAALSAVTP